MSDNEQKNETVDDVLAEMVRASIIHVYIPTTDLERYVNRIKAACKREKAALYKENSAAKKHRRTKTYDPEKILHEYWRDHYEV